MDLLKPRVVHVDGDSDSLAKMKKIFIETDEVEYLEGFTDPDIAVSYIVENLPEIVFIDIQFPEHNGIEIALAMRDLPVSFVFLCGDPGYAMEAFQVSPVTFLLKFPSVMKVKDTLELWKRNNPLHKLDRTVKFIASKALDRSEGVKIQKRIILHTLHSIQIIDLSRLMTIEAKLNYTLFNLSDQNTITSSKNLKVYEDMLKDHPDFIRISRSCIVNKGHIRKIKKTDHRKTMVILDNGKEILLTGLHKEELLQKLIS